MFQVLKTFHDNIFKSCLVCVHFSLGVTGKSPGRTESRNRSNSGFELDVDVKSDQGIFKMVGEWQYTCTACSGISSDSKGEISASYKYSEASLIYAFNKSK